MQNLYVETWPLKQLIDSGMSCCTHLLRYFNYAKTPCCHTDIINNVQWSRLFEVSAMGIFFFIFFFCIMIPLWGEFHVINNTALQHRVLLLLGFPLLKLFLKSFWLYSWLLLQNWVLQQIAWLTKGEKNVASKQTIMMTLKHNINVSLILSQRTGANNE